MVVLNNLQMTTTGFCRLAAFFEAEFEAFASHWPAILLERRIVRKHCS